MIVFHMEEVWGSFLKKFSGVKPLVSPLSKIMEISNSFGIELKLVKWVDGVKNLVKLWETELFYIYGIE